MRQVMKESKVFIVSKTMNVDLEITRFTSLWEKRFGGSQLLLFTDVAGYPDFSVAMNVLQRQSLLRSLNLDHQRWLETVSKRLHSSQPTLSIRPPSARQQLDSLDRLPVMTHQPRDKGRYLTSAVTCLVDPGTGVPNLGCYRIYISGPQNCVVFMDPRTDGYKIFEKYQEMGRVKVPLTVFLGGPLGAHLAGATGIPIDENSYAFLSRISGCDVELDDGMGGVFPPAPAEAEVVIRGFLTPTLGWEGPFGEFKGYYSTPTQSPIMDVVDIRCRHDAIFPGLFCGKESGLTLMAVQKEMLMYHKLRSQGYEIDDVSNPLSAFGEYLSIIRTRSPSRDVLKAAMDADKRTKVFVVGKKVESPLSQLGINPISAMAESYMRRGKPHGQRLGICIDDEDDYTWVEY